MARIEWDAAIKPLTLDAILWKAYVPDVDRGGPRQRLNPNGAVIVDAP
jgi:hypothetical protein